MLEGITRRQVHLWYAVVAADLEPDLSAAYQSMLTPEEKARHHRFVFEKDRKRYLTTRALLRVALSRYAPIAPKNWEFESNAYGRPQIKNRDPLIRKLDFNLSHTQNLVLLAIATGRRVGVDTENITEHAPIELANETFSQRERADLFALPRSAWQNRFWELWTLKESYVKAHGMGLSLPLDSFSFHFPEQETVEISFLNPAADSSSKWQFWQFIAEPSHLFSVCLENTGNDPVSFICRSIEPLRTESLVDASKIRYPATERPLRKRSGNP